MMGKKVAYKLLILLLATTVVFASLLSGCGSEPGSAHPAGSSKICEYTSFGEDITEQVKESVALGDALLLEDSEYRLVMDGNGVLKVLDDSDNVAWSTGFTGSEQAPSDESFASSTLRYHLKEGNFQNVDTYSACYERDQFRFYRDGETLVHEQIIGDYTGARLMPEALTEDPFEMFVSQMSERDAKYIRQQYALYTAEDAPADMLEKIPALQKRPLYVLMSSEGYVRRARIHSAFESAGYTGDDLEADRETVGMTNIQSEVFKLVTKYRFENGDLIMEIPCEELVWTESNPLISINLMEYGAFAYPGSNGSYIIPSGAGAQFDFAPNKKAYYTLLFDGPDYADMLYGNEQDYSGHPVYGLLREGVGNVAIIEEGSEVIRLHVESVPDGYVQYPEVMLRPNQSTTLGDKEPYYLFSDKVYTGNIRIRYSFLQEEKATYSEMAARYGNYLEKIGAFADKEIKEALPFEMEVINTLRTKKKMLGFSYDVVRAVTTFQETQSMLEWFSEQGVENIWLKLNGANNEGLFIQEPGEFNFSKKAGGKEAYAALMSYCQKAGIPSFLQVNLPFHFMDRWNDGYSPDDDTVRHLDKSLVQLYLKEKSTSVDRVDLPIIEVVSPSKYLKYVENYVSKSSQLGSGLSVGELARLLNSDFVKDASISREDSKKIVEKCLEKLDSTYDLLAENPSVYTLAHLYAFEKMPMSSSQYNYFERDIPLIPMALHGRLMYTSTYWNNQPDQQIAMLRAIEYGSGIAYRFAQSINKEDVTDQNSFLYNVDYELWRERAVSGYKYVAEALNGLGETKMKEHVYLTDTVVRVLYENGTVIYINYGNEAVSIDGVSIEANAYLRK